MQKNEIENKILEMLEMQDTLNTNTNDANWRDWLTTKWKVINWKRCIYMETAEAIDSISWKHWKNVEGGIDYENFKVELIDIWHFLMSYLLRFYSKEDLVKIILNYLDEKSEVKLPKELNAEENLRIDKILLPYENLMMSSLKKEESEEFNKNFIKEFFICLDSAWISFEELYWLYIWKNVLNKFRQEHWYKEWTYVKVLWWKEDNFYMQKIIENTSWFENIYNELEKIYKKYC